MNAVSEMPVDWPSEGMPLDEGDVSMEELTLVEALYPDEGHFDPVADDDWLEDELKDSNHEESVAFSGAKVFDPALSKKEMEQIKKLLHEGDECTDPAQIELFTVSEAPCNDHDWDDLQQMDTVREYLLEDVLSNLNDNRVGAVERQLSLVWILSDEIHPFSYVACCRAIGVDHRELRLKLLTLID